MQHPKLKYKRSLVALTLSIISFVALSGCRNYIPSKTAPDAIRGTLDLTGWDFAKDGPVQLKGEWEFYWQQHLAPEALSKSTGSQKPDFIRVPNYWNNYEIGGVNLPGEGYATYRLRVLIAKPAQALALRLMEISTAYRLFVNGRDLISAGVAGAGRDATTPKWFRQVVDVKSDAHELEIVLQVSNFHHRKGGMWEVMELGRETDIRLSQERRLGFDLFLFGSIAIMGLYHLGLFVFMRRDRSPLYFSIFCCLISLRLISTGERFLIRLLPNASWETLTKLEYFSFYLAVPAFSLFIQSLFPKFSKRFLNAVCLVAGGFSFIVLFTPARIYSQINPFYEILTCATILYSLYVILISLNEKRIEAFVFLLGFTVLALMTVNDILYVESIIKTGYFAPFGFFIFIFSQSFLLSYRFSNAMATVESQGRDLMSTLKSYKTEIINRTEAEKALRQSEEKYRTILNSIEEGYCEMDPDGNLTFFNDSLCEILGYHRDELLGMNCRWFMGDKTAERVYKTFNDVYPSGKATRVFGWESIGKDGQKKYIESSVSSMLDSKGRPVGLRVVARDVTERKQAEERANLHQQQLMRASKMVALGTLVSGVAHEINNPNNFIMLNAPILKEAWENATPILENYYEENGDFVIGGMNYSDMRGNILPLFGGISEGARRIKDIVENLNNYVRGDSADVNQTVDVNAVLFSAVSLVSNMIKKSTNRFDIDYGKNLPLLKGNFQRLEQVAVNLIQNACQALAEADRGIFISTSLDEKTASIIIKVKDEGVGIAPETMPQITNPFFTTKQKSGGVGLGLSISSRIIEEHGGSIQFESQSGAGTTVKVILPIDR